MQSQIQSAAGALARELAQMPRRTTEDCLAVDEAVISILTLLADALDDCDSYGITLDAASDIRAKVQATREVNSRRNERRAA